MRAFLKAFLKDKPEWPYWPVLSLFFADNVRNRRCCDRERVNQEAAARKAVLRESQPDEPPPPPSQN
ncbi:uncharacterized protein SEPMUDRAFT_115654 [Sphaerulina musiva SO2202]|uniref:Uncharacterized protein n=1 Tax=Sphaerulina musiva (strain SO2202) TaxID=692275 RepID=M3CKT5_SPHMS|nr:uncharacterized protein SEPMUDRAFT_115654 [Sphaerulina musiva SO2202]EMF14378.1 hypothetical protein SEPMUDRAFT_115654 [Sphaerulina musiva SO2202]